MLKTQPSSPPTRILFVCMANICRSPMAEAVARSIAKTDGIAKSFIFDSAGTISNFAGQAPDERAKQVTTEHGYSMDGIKARTITIRDFEKFDLILAMDRTIFLSLQRICPEAYHSKVRLFLDYVPNEASDDVPDPYYGNLVGFEHVLDLCEKGARTLLRCTPTQDARLEQPSAHMFFLKRIRKFLTWNQR